MCGMAKSSTSTNAAPISSNLLTEKELAARWQVNPGWLATLRSQRRGPVYRKIGFNVRYRVSDVEAYEDKHAVNTSGTV